MRQVIIRKRYTGVQGSFPPKSRMRMDDKEAALWVEQGLAAYADGGSVPAVAVESRETAEAREIKGRRKASKG